MFIGFKMYRGMLSVEFGFLDLHSIFTRDKLEHHFREQYLVLGLRELPAQLWGCLYGP